MKTIKGTIYIIYFKSKADSVWYTMTTNFDGMRLFTKLDEVEKLLEEHGFEKLANSGSDENVVSRFVNMNYTDGQDRVTYFDTPRAEIIKEECEFEVAE